MFRFSLYLSACRLEGIEALDYRRAMKLKDDVILHVPSRTWWYSVTEDFARSHFPHDVCSPAANIPLRVLDPGGLKDDVQAGSTVTQEFTKDRAESLFLEFFKAKDVKCSG